MAKVEQDRMAGDSRSDGRSAGGQDTGERIGDILEEVAHAGDTDQVSFGEIMDAFGRRVYGPMLMVPAFIAVAPTGMIPGMSVLTGGIIALIAAQLLIMRETPWLPAMLKDKSFERDKLKSSVSNAGPYVETVDHYIRPRLAFLAKPPAVQVVAIACLVMAATMFPLALLPFAVAIPGTAVLLFGIGLSTHDGYFVIAGLVLSLVAVGMPFAWSIGWFGG